MLSSEAVHTVIQAEDGRDDTAAGGSHSQSRFLQGSISHERLYAELHTYTTPSD